MGKVLRLTVPDDKLYVLIDLDVKCQFKRWHRDSSIYNLLEISEGLSIFMLILRLLAREVWPSHTIFMLEVLWAFLGLFLSVRFASS